MQIAMDDMRMRPWPGRTHRFLQVPALYPFGHGLSYSHFEYSRLAASPLVGPASDSDGGGTGLEVSVDVQNAGGMAGEEVVLLFLSFRPPGPGEGSDAGQVLLKQPGEAGTVEVRVGCSAPLLHGDHSPTAVPKQTLAAFQRVALQPGEPARVALHVTAAELAAAASGALEGSKLGVACGEYALRVGPLSATLAVPAPQAEPALSAE